MKLLTTITSLLASLVIAKADGSLNGLVYAPGHASLDYYTYPSYAFEYAVRDPHTGDNKAQWEKRDGDVVTGAYSLVEPDGTIRVVEYRADDKSGFNAVVKRVGPNLHPVTAPIYKAPLPLLGEKLINPISIGPVAGLKGLASAPILNGPILGGSIPSLNLYKSTAPALIKDLEQIAPIAQTLPAPILPAPIIKGPLLGPSAPIWKEPLLGPSPQTPIWKEPLLGPLPLGPLPKVPIWKGPQLGLLPQAPLPIIKPILPPALPYTPLLTSLPITKPLWTEPILKKELISAPSPYLPLLKGPLDLPTGGKWGADINLDYDLIGKGLLGKENIGWGH